MLRRTSLVAIALVSLLVPATASTLEDATSGAVAYQYDAGTHHDAPDGCDAADARWSLPLGGSIEGLLTPPDDFSDAYVIQVPASAVGQRIHLAVDEPTDTQDLMLDGFVPGCGSLLDAINWPVPTPAPAEPAPTERQLAFGVQPQVCEPNHWVWVLDGMNGLAAPASIHVAWTDGTEKLVPLANSNKNHAAYVIEENLGTTLKGAWLNMPLSFNGTHGLFIGPCDTQDGGAVYGDPPALDLGVISFTPIRAGPHVAVVSWQAGTPTADASDLSLASPRSCHFCLGPIGDLAGRASYVLTARQG